MTSKDRKKFLDPNTLTEAALQVYELAQQFRVRVALIGGFALQFYGSDRLTGDVDLVADSTIESLAGKDTLAFGGIKATAPNGTPVDIVVRTDEYEALYLEALDSSTTREGSPIPIVSPEYLAAMKMAAGRPKDTGDLEFLIETKAIDPLKTKDIIRRHLGPYAAREFDNLVQFSLWKSSTKSTDR